jgi:hypothetical protein
MPVILAIWAKKSVRPHLNRKKSWVWWLIAVIPVPGQKINKKEPLYPK